MQIHAVHVDRARELLGTELAALVGESYERAYMDMVRVQQLTELEEVIDYSQVRGAKIRARNPRETLDSSPAADRAGGGHWHWAGVGQTPQKTLRRDISHAWSPEQLCKCPCVDGMHGCLQKVMLNP